MVAIQAAVDGVPEISLGDVVGSNVLNIARVLALVLSWSGMKAEESACAVTGPAPSPSPLSWLRCYGMGGSRGPMP